jgi:hypothetical protein
MRVPSIGLTRDERRIVAEGYRLAERMLAGYEDPPSLAATIGRWLAQLRMVLARD